MKINLNYIIIACLMIFISILCYNNMSLRKSNSDLKYNYIAASDSLSIVRMENDKLLYEKNAYILKESEMNELLNMTKSEMKDIKKQLNSSINYISKLEGMVSVDTIRMTDTIYYKKDSINTIKFGYNDGWLSINGVTTFDPDPKTSLTNIRIPVTIETGLTEDKNIFVLTDNPYVSITDIKGAYIKEDISKINFHHGVYLGLGFQYGLFSRNIDFGPQIGYGFIIEF